MPVYEFYCPDCHTVFSFWSQRVNTDKTPECPGCQGDRLRRIASASAVISGKKGEGEDEFGDLPIDESKMESALASLASEAEGLDEEDPRAMARFMRKFSDETGLKYNEGMEEMLSRLEAGEDPEALEEEMDDLLDDEELPFEFTGKGGIRKSLPPRRDDTLYDL